VPHNDGLSGASELVEIKPSGNSRKHFSLGKGVYDARVADCPQPWCCGTPYASPGPPSRSSS